MTNRSDTDAVVTWIAGPRVRDVWLWLGEYGFRGLFTAPSGRATGAQTAPRRRGRVKRVTFVNWDYLGIRTRCRLAVCLRMGEVSGFAISTVYPQHCWNTG